MTVTFAAPWHKASFERFLHEQLPQLLATRLPLIDCQVNTSDERYTYQVTITVGNATATYSNLLQPDDEGLFVINGQQYAVVPYAEHDDLASARVLCVGEQLFEYIQQRLGKAPADMAWDETLLRAWLPLDVWTQEFFANKDRDNIFVQWLSATNWLSRKQHLRRLFIKDRQHLFRPGHMGRTCPFETPEGPNIARILTLAVGASIQDERVVIVDERPEAGLGLSASMIPFLEHNHPYKLLMGANMQWQWITPPDPEPALVQSGNEPENADFWCGRNLLTAFVSWGEDTFEEGIVLSRSAARKLHYPRAVEPGDKLSDRHGTKGVVSRILPDEEMPHLANGMPIELIFHAINFHTRLSLGPIHEAVMGRVAHEKGNPIIVPPLHAPNAAQMCTQLRQAGLAEEGQAQLFVHGKPLEQSSTFGWVYWGKLDHLAHDKIQIAVTGSHGQRGQRQGELEYSALRAAGANETIKEQYNTRASTASNAGTLLQRVRESTITQNAAPTPSFAELTRRLTAAGIAVALQEQALTFRLARPEQALQLTQPMPHPWLPDERLTHVGVYPELAEYGALVEANSRLGRVRSSRAPASLLAQAQQQLTTRVQEFFAALLPPEKLQLEARVLFSGRAVLAPGARLQHDQVGIPDEIAWALFGPQVARVVGLDVAEQRGEQAAQALDEIMARSWVLLERSPALTPQAFLAFHPVRDPGRVLRLPTLACRLLRADFDGDQAAIFLPLTAAGQREAGDTFSIAAHLTREPAILPALLPRLEALWGLAYLSSSAEGYQALNDCATIEVARSSGVVTQTTLGEALQRVLQRDGVEQTLVVIEQLSRRGFAAAQSAGASIAPFIGLDGCYPVQSSEHEWEVQVEALAACTDYQNSNFGNQLLAVKSGASGEIRHMLGLSNGQPATLDVNGRLVPIQHGYRDGLTPEELFAAAVAARETFASVLQEIEQSEVSVHIADHAHSYHVLARALRSRQPGIVFAHAAALGEVDPLTDEDSRLFVGV
ncbi:MAG TPA: hypothetical protein VHZ51_09720 [Ktedonobacteraceae bacterium]|nr:hypothetical protein [Ktedonobacteraceae bacterium]